MKPSAAENKTFAAECHDQNEKPMVQRIEEEQGQYWWSPERETEGENDADRSN